jgi:hypothetical protein
MMSMFLRSIGKPIILVQIALVAVALLIVSSPVAANTESTNKPADTSQEQNQPNVTCPNGQCFTDVLPSNNFFDYINRIYQDGIVTGYACGGANEPCDAQHRPYYRPSNNITRQGMAKFIDNARHLPQISLEASSNTFLLYVHNTNTTSINPAMHVLSSGHTAGLWAGSVDGAGVDAESSNGDGLLAYTNVPYAHPDVVGYAGHFYGDVYVSGHITATGGCCLGPELVTRIDNPLDPANKYLNESAVQSPDRTTVINGNIVLDGKGEATVSLPAWFVAANGDFRYTLTAIGAPGPNLYVAQEVSGNEFKIAGGTSRGKVSWQVMGIRQDPYASAHPMVVEQDKPANLKGKYQNPAEYGQPASLGVDYEQQQKLQQRLEQSMQGNTPQASGNKP